MRLPELLGDMLLLLPSDTLKIDQPLLIVTSVHDGRLLIAFEVDGRQILGLSALVWRRGHV